MSAKNEKLRIFATAPLRGEGLDRLRAMGDVILEPWLEQRPLRIYNSEKLAERIIAENANVLICEVDSCKGPVLDLPLVAIGSTRGDPTNVDVPAASAAGVPVLRAPGRNADAVAELAVALVFAATRGLVPADRSIREGPVYAGGTNPYLLYRGWQLAGLTVGIVGYGAVGRAAAWRFAGLGMKVIIADPFAPEATHDLDSLLAEADVISMHAAVTPDTFGLISAEKIKKIKKGAVYVNTARAALHDLDALTEALASGQLSAMGLDHFNGEHLPVTHQLVGMDNVVLTPHIGGATFDTEANHTSIIASGLEALLRGEAPDNLVNPEVLKNG
jgi:D-3-phosphoglycerate dehydrogenase